MTGVCPDDGPAVAPIQAAIKPARKPWKSMFEPPERHQLFDTQGSPHSAPKCLTTCVIAGTTYLIAPKWLQSYQMIFCSPEAFQRASAILGGTISSRLPAIMSTLRSFSLSA